MKKNNKGFVLAETLVVTTFVAGVLIYMFIQFTNLNQKYNESFIYNTVEDLYALQDVKEYIETDFNALNYIDININNLLLIDITDCEIFTDKSYCLDLLKYENIDNILITTNNPIYNNISLYNKNFQTFIKKIKTSGNEPYRIIASFKDNTFATVRFGE